MWVALFLRNGIYIHTIFSPPLSSSLLSKRLSRTQKMGRIHKHMADLYLITGQLQPACDNFGHALSLLSRDPLWEGSANEGLGATLIMKKKHDDIRQGTKTADLSIPSNVFGFLKVSQRILKVSVCCVQRTN